MTAANFAVPRYAINGHEFRWIRIRLWLLSNTEFVPWGLAQCQIKLLNMVSDSLARPAIVEDGDYSFVLCYLGMIANPLPSNKPSRPNRAGSLHIALFCRRVPPVCNTDTPRPALRLRPRCHGVAAADDRQLTRHALTGLRTRLCGSRLCGPGLHRGRGESGHFVELCLHHPNRRRVSACRSASTNKQ
jgi:hypothetical protein